jgi:drug/metabolite transporter (DMT)-like permease
MKLNFWQWLGVALLILGAALWLYERSGSSPATPSPPTSQTP